MKAGNERKCMPWQQRSEMAWLTNAAAPPPLPPMLERACLRKKLKRAPPLPVPVLLLGRRLPLLAPLLPLPPAELLPALHTAGCREAPALTTEGPKCARLVWAACKPIVAEAIWSSGTWRGFRC